MNSFLLFFIKQENVVNFLFMSRTIFLNAVFFQYMTKDKVSGISIFSLKKECICWCNWYKISCLTDW